ncbi:MAG: 4-hydroxy-3-methylbut-2-enyl diphosphate reductase [Melioribacteraceae bacterium]|nr:4-hydroxy-3-methylbut-2-enyl diphosphate reductase [Melioribacteraceae bacterium]
MKKFDIPLQYKSSIISRLKEMRRNDDPRKKNFSPTRLSFGPVEFLVSRHFGFCYGVENAIEIAYKTLNENPEKRIFLLSEMIHNPAVNKDLIDRGIRFIMDNYGNQYIDWDEITKDDIVIIPAFGTTIEIEKLLKEKGIDKLKYNTTCPFVEKVWNRAEALSKKDFTIVIHGKHKHEETRATFSHSAQNSPSIIVKDIEEADYLSKFMFCEITKEEFLQFFDNKYTVGFDPHKDLQRIGVVNQTTMLATETEEISELLRQAMISKYGEVNLKDHFADTRDTLCYATNDNQSATDSLIEYQADFAIVVGGYNSSNTSHLVELLEERFKTYFISDADKIEKDKIMHFDMAIKSEVETVDYLPNKNKVVIAITSGASCPDSIIDQVLMKLLSFYDTALTPAEVLDKLT